MERHWRRYDYFSGSCDVVRHSVINGSEGGSIHNRSICSDNFEKECPNSSTNGRSTLHETKANQFESHEEFMRCFLECQRGGGEKWRGNLMSGGFIYDGERGHMTIARNKF